MGGGSFRLLVGLGVLVGHARPYTTGSRSGTRPTRGYSFVVGGGEGDGGGGEGNGGGGLGDGGLGGGGLGDGGK